MGKEIIVVENPKSPEAEMFRNLRTNIQFMNANSEKKVMVVTSTVPGEGKSFITANLATAFANSGSKVLLVDCDIRKGRQHRIFNSHNKKGLSNLLLDDVRTVYRNYINETVIKNLSIICKGMTPPNPSELLQSERLDTLFVELRKRYDCG